MIDAVIRESGIGSTSTSISHPRSAEDADLVPRTRRPAALPAPPACCSAALLAALGLPLLTVVLAQIRDDARAAERPACSSCCSWSAVAAVGGLWPGARRRGRGFLLANWYFTPPLYTFTIAEGENMLALTVFLAVAGIVSGFVALAARRAAEGRAPAPRRRRSARGSQAPPPLRACSTDCRRVARARRGSGAAAAPAAAGASRPPAATRTGEPRERRTTIDARRGPPARVVGGRIRADDQRVLDAFAARARRLGRARGARAPRQRTASALAAANELRTALLSAVSHDLRTPLAAIKASVTSLLQQDVDWTPDATGVSSCRRSTRRPTASTRWSATCST